MTVPDNYLDPAMWRGFNVNTLYTGSEDGQVRPERQEVADLVYHPSHEIPAFLFCRVSESTKRLENGLEAEQVSAGPEGKVFTVVGSGSTIGIVFVVDTEQFSKAHCTPDGANLLNANPKTMTLKWGYPIIKPIYEFKTFRAFRIGPSKKDDEPHDLMVTAKKRNPKFLGFSKDDKV
jgi:hypothetical protein